jgi:GH24 family phage-related lysozyme (muramidase)
MGFNWAFKGLMGIWAWLGHSKFEDLTLLRDVNQQERADTVLVKVTY